MSFVLKLLPLQRGKFRNPIEVMGSFHLRIHLHHSGLAPEKLYLVIESVKPDTKHRQSPTAPAPADGAEE